MDELLAGVVVLIGVGAYFWLARRKKAEQPGAEVKAGPKPNDPR